MPNRVRLVRAVARQRVRISHSTDQTVRSHYAAERMTHRRQIVTPLHLLDQTGNATKNAVSPLALPVSGQGMSALITCHRKC